MRKGGFMLASNVINQMKKKIRQTIVIVTMILVSLLVSETISASSINTRPATESEVSTTKSSAVGFSVKPVYGKGQRQGDVNYWSLLVQPKQVVKLQLEIINGDTEHQFDVAVNQAVTNGNLTVDYSKSEQIAKSMLSGHTPIDFAKMAKVADSQKNQTTMTVAKNTVMTVPITITVPAQPFDGQAVGGVAVTRHATANEKKKTINNVYNYTYAVLMTGSKETVKPDVSLVSLKAQAKQFDNTVTVNVQNTTNAIVSGIAVNGEVTNSKGKQVAKMVMKNGTISPLAKFGLVFRNTEAQWAPGKYHVKLTMTDKAKHTWIVDQDVVIKEKKTVFEQVKAPRDKQSNNWLVSVLVALIVLLVGLSGFWYYRFRRQQNKAS